MERSKREKEEEWIVKGSKKKEERKWGKEDGIYLFSTISMASLLPKFSTFKSGLLKRFSPIWRTKKEHGKDVFLSVAHTKLFNYSELLEKCQEVFRDPRDLKREKEKRKKYFRSHSLFFFMNIHERNVLFDHLENGKWRRRSSKNDMKGGNWSSLWKTAASKDETMLRDHSFNAEIWQDR